MKLFRPFLLKKTIKTLYFFSLNGYNHSEVIRMINEATWITPVNDMGEVCPVFRKTFDVKGTVKSAVLYITANGTYEASLNGARISDYVLAPGWTEFSVRHQYQIYDVADMLGATNTLDVTVGRGWQRGRIHFDRKKIEVDGAKIIAALDIEYADEKKESVFTDSTWSVYESPVLFSDIYDGETYDATHTDAPQRPVIELRDENKSNLIPQEGEIICEHERIKPAAYFVTPKGERVIDFGQNMTGYIEFSLEAKAGEKVRVSHAEILDRDGNFYNENYRTAKAEIEYVCRDGYQTYKPHLVFFGFRYIRLDEFPSEVDPDAFTAIVVHSDIKRTGYLESSDPLLNKLFDNIVWGQKSNFLDIPTDCPQRDERLGWTGDAQVFIKTASYNFDVYKFFKKWLADLAAAQKLHGLVPHYVPTMYKKCSHSSSAWGDAATICPWQIYMTYGDKEILEAQFDCMKERVDWISRVTEEKNLWIGEFHFGDWLALDAADPSDRSGGSDRAFIASAFYARSCELVIKAGKALERDVSEYEELYLKIKKAFAKRFPEYRTQTEHVLALYFGLAENKKAAADSLAKMIEENGCTLKTGFVGTPYLLHSLSENGHTELAYSLLLQEKFPSWLFSVKMGATTIWEHWDGINEAGELWDNSMNSFNHYAYGSVADWVYEVACGITPAEPGFSKVRIAPRPDKRLEHLSAKIETRRGTVSSKWTYERERVRFEITTPSPAEIIIGNKTYNVEKGSYVFFD